mmetsp:Transcript_2921/g.7017  ORF Transcript_2921/g.7017 Transcript_2921/m.7017 type:complete len:110 (+) Transcript_2921:140-469(+)
MRPNAAQRNATQRNASNDETREGKTRQGKTIPREIVVYTIFRSASVAHCTARIATLVGLLPGCGLVWCGLMFGISSDEYRGGKAIILYQPHRRFEDYYLLVRCIAWINE